MNLGKVEVAFKYRHWEIASFLLSVQSRNSSTCRVEEESGWSCRSTQLPVMPHIQFTKLCRHCADPSVYIIVGQTHQTSFCPLFILFLFLSFFLSFWSMWRAYNANSYVQERICVFADKRPSLIHMHGGLKLHLSDHMVVFCSALAQRIRVEPNSVTENQRRPCVENVYCLTTPLGPTFYTHPYSPPLAAPPPPSPGPVYLLLPYFFPVYVMCICRYFKDVVRFCLRYHWWLRSSMEP